MKNKYSELSIRECEALIKQKCKSLDDHPLNPFMIEEEYNPRKALALEIIQLLDRKLEQK